ncbi:unnamed protein product [Larinioides sclopetarius]|uniref:Uncharacterized protein n=1 Tax=Larinioides sclopetarius TaxID=280406 RepID=A0AAV1ZYF3_9ARAC
MQFLLSYQYIMSQFNHNFLSEHKDTICSTHAGLPLSVMSKLFMIRIFFEEN